MARIARRAPDVAAVVDRGRGECAVFGRGSITAPPTVRDRGYRAPGPHLGIRRLGDSDNQRKTEVREVMQGLVDADEPPEAGFGRVGVERPV